jgi:hypothetical protein
MTDEIIIRYARMYTNLGKLASYMYRNRHEVDEYCELQSLLHPGYNQRRFIQEVFAYREYLESIEVTQ